MANNLVSLKEKPPSKTEMSTPVARDYYPSIYLNSDQAKALGLDKVPVGKELDMDGLVCVSSRSVSERENGNGSRVSVTLELRSAKIDAGKESKEPADVLYGEG